MTELKEKEESIFERIRREADEKRDKKEAEQERRNEFFNSIKNDELDLRFNK